MQYRAGRFRPPPVRRHTRWVGTKVGAFVNHSIVYQPHRNPVRVVAHKRQRVDQAYRLRAARHHALFVGTKAPPPPTHSAPNAPRHLPSTRRRPWRRLHQIVRRPPWIGTIFRPDPIICYPTHVTLAGNGRTGAACTGYITELAVALETPTRAVLAFAGVTHATVICSDLPEIPPVSPPPPSPAPTIVMVTA